MPIPADQRYYLKLKALYYLYEKRYTNTDTAKALGISRVTLNRLLEEARAEEMIKIEIVDNRNIKQLLEMEEKIKLHYGLADVKIVNVVSDDVYTINSKLAVEGAKYFELFLRSNMRIGMTWGRTLRLLVNNLVSNPTIENLEVYTLLGGAYNEPDFQPNILAQEMIQLYSGRTFILNAPFMCHTEHLCDEIKKDPQIAQVLDSNRIFDLTLVGIGAEPTFENAKSSYYHFSDEIIESLLAAGAVGDICGNFFDINGNLCDSIIKNKMVSIDISKIHHNHKKVIGVGGGPGKSRSILGALNGHYLDVLITDIGSAYNIMEQMSKE